MSSDDSLSALLGSYDNLGEPQPTANKRASVLGVTVTCILMSWMCVMFRFYTRIFVTYALGWDDFFLVLVMVVGLTGAICICMLPSHGLGEHFILLSTDEMATYLKLFYIGNGTYTMSTTLIKISLLLQYLRIFRSRKMKYACYVLLTVCSLWGAAFSILAWVPCTPVSNFWSVLIPDSEKQSCFGYGALTRGQFVETFLGHAGFNMGLDLLVLSLPVHLYFDTNGTGVNKMGLGGLLSGGCLVVCISTWRLATLIDHQATTSPTFDPSWYSPISVILSIAEVNVATICASVPVFWPVLTSSLEEIFVTKEIQIVSETRGDEFELHSRSGSTGTFDGYHSSVPSSIHGVERTEVMESQDADFRMVRCDLFKSASETEKGTAGVRTLIRSESVTRDKSLTRDKQRTGHS
ncbi:hypothetical protein LQW54_001236 [Pestalotiopsis sp. IQ-011]